MIEKGPSAVNDRIPPRWLPYAAGVCTLGLVLLGVGGWFVERSFLEKLVTQLALPCGLIWIALLYLTLIAFRHDRWWGMGLLSLSVVYWVAGAGATSDRFLSSLEGRYHPLDTQEVEPFDVLIVLGGGTISNPEGNVWLGPNGERVMLAARLYQLGKVRRLVSTGRLFDWAARQGVDPAAAAARIWDELGIPAEAVTQIGGRNTSQEMVLIRDLLQSEEHRDQRVGLLTSAFHLPRAMRLAEANGLNVEPVAAGFRIRMLPPWPLAIIPSSEGFLNTELCMREYLAYVVGR